MDEDELAQLRAARMAEMQKNAGQSDKAKAEQMAAQKQQQEEAKNAMLTQIMDQDARARLANIAVANADKARQVENMIIQMARYGKIPGKMDDDMLKDLLNQISDKTKAPKTTVKFDRRRAAIDSDED